VTQTDKSYAEVIGDPIAQSKSPLIHGFWLDRLGIDAEYRRVHVTAEALPGYLTERRADPNWRGCNVTMPHKLAVLDLVGDPGDVRGSIGAMNTIIRQGEAGQGTLVGTNTDAAGFWAPLDGLDLAGRPVAVIGTGGAARAVLFALKQVGCGPVTLVARNPLKAAGLLGQFGLKGQTLTMGGQLPPAALLVNASSLGMAGQPPLNLDLAPLADDALVYDVVTAPVDTPLLTQARARGLETVDGLEMLVGQAAVAFELFFGAAPPRDGDEELRTRLLLQ
jgi:shikimate dehydrogenase